MPPRARPKPPVHRNRTQSFMLRLNEAERDMLDGVAARLSLTRSECMRYLIRRAAEEPESAKRK